VTGRVLVTGAGGFVGAALVPELTRRGMLVRAMTRAPEAISSSHAVEVVSVPDLRDPPNWAPLLAGIDSVVHLAGIAHVGYKIDAEVYDRVNHVATAELAERCAHAGVKRLVFLSSVLAQSGPAADHRLTESDPPRPTGNYGRSKLAAEEAIRAGGAAWTILRPVLVYGPGSKGNFATLARLAALPVPLPFSSFTNHRSILGVKNLIEAICFVLAEPATAGETYLVSDPSPATVGEIITALRSGLGRAAMLFPLPPAWFAAALKVAGREDVWERLGGSLVVDPGKLIAAGWRPDADTKGALAHLQFGRARER
jgi:nucleoside-diphosphate-sugar epimerase